jgi:hypothetical protein
MKFPSLPAVDAAAIIASVTGTLYLLGLANIQGDALALQVPFLLLKREVPETIAMGTEGVLMTVFAPGTVLFAGGKPQWHLISVLLQAIVFGLLIRYFFSSRSWGGPVLVLWLLASLYWYVLWASMAFMSLHIERSAHCFENIKTCDSRVHRARIEYSTVSERLESREGALLLASNESVVMHTVEGVLLVPKERVRSVQSLRSAVRKPEAKNHSGPS